MSLRLLRQIPNAKRVTACLCLSPRRPYSAQSAIQLRQSSEDGQPTSHDTNDEHSPVATETATSKRRVSRTTESEEGEASSSKPVKASRAKTRVNDWLAHLQLEGVEPTLEDLDRHRPKAHPRRDSARYVTKYNELADLICRSFSKTQLQKLVRLGGLQSQWKRSSRKKLDYAELIIEGRWGWPRLEEVIRERRDRTEVSSELFSVTPTQLFLILGRDGADLLQLSKKYNTHISLVREPLALSLEGLRGSITKLREVLKSLTKNIVEETIQLPTHSAIRPDLVQRISRLAEAHIENVGDRGLIRVTAKDQRSLGSAKRLASRASGEMVSSTSIPLVSYLPAGVPSRSDIPELISPYMYAMYPFLSPRTLPWYMNTSGAFRVRRVGEWLQRVHGEMLVETGGLAGGLGTLLSLDHNPVELRDALFTRLPTPSSNSRRIVKASTGHVLFTTKSKVQRATLLPPLKSPHQFARVLKWISENDVRSSFVPSLPASLVHSVPSEQKIVHRLIYKSLPTADQTSSAGKSPSQSNVITFEVVIAVDNAASEPSDAEVGHNLSIDPRWQKGTETAVDLMMPDRSMDIRLTALDVETIPENAQPPALEEYTSELREFLLNPGEENPQPDPPLTLHAYGEQYMLHTSASVRQSTERLRPEEQSANSVTVISESILDLESSQRTTACEITCEDPTSETSWQEFLSGCDSLSTASYRATEIPSPENSQDMQGEEGEEFEEPYAGHPHDDEV